MNAAAQHELVRAVRAELAVPGRYHLETVTRVRRSWLQLALQWIADRYNDFVHALTSRVHVAPGTISLLGDFVIIAAVLVLGYVAARLLIAMQIERAQRARVTALVTPRSATALARQARDAAECGEYSRAVRLLFAATVTLLDLRGVIHDESSATVNDLRRTLGARGEDIDRPFSEIARAFTAAAYAEEPLDAATWDRAANAYAALSSRVTSA